MVSTNCQQFTMRSHSAVMTFDKLYSTDRLLDVQNSVFFMQVPTGSAIELCPDRLNKPSGFRLYGFEGITELTVTPHNQTAVHLLLSTTSTHDWEHLRQEVVKLHRDYKEATTDYNQLLHSLREPPPTGANGISITNILLIVVIIIVLLGFVVLLTWCCCKRSSSKSTTTTSNNVVSLPPQIVMPSASDYGRDHEPKNTNRSIYPLV